MGSYKLSIVPMPSIAISNHLTSWSSFVSVYFHNTTLQVKFYEVIAINLLSFYAAVCDILMQIVLLYKKSSNYGGKPKDIF